MSKHIFWLIVAFVVILSAFPAQPAALAAPAAGGPAVSDVRVGKPAVFETFPRDTGTWGKTSAATRSFADGMLIIRVTESNKVSWSTYDGRPDEFGDFYLEVDSAHRAGPLENNFGVAFRMRDGDNFYLFEIDCNGHYDFMKLVADEWKTIVDWTTSSALNKGRGCENSLGVLAVGDWIVLQANDKEIKRVRDDTFSAGQIALVAGAYDKAGTEVGFDNLRLWQAATNQGGASGGVSSGSASVTSDTLNVRSGPSTAYPVVATLRGGDSVQMVGRTADSQWVKISLSGQSQAWVAARYLSSDTRIEHLPVANAPAPPAAAPGSSCGNKAFLRIENHIGRYITLQISDNNFRVEGKVGDVPGTLRITLNGTGRYTMAAQLPNGGSTNFDLYVEPTPNLCANRTGCMALCETRTIPFWLQ